MGPVRRLSSGVTPGKEHGWDMFKLKEKILNFGDKGHSHEEPMVGKGSGQLWGCCLSHHLLRRCLSCSWHRDSACPTKVATALERLG